MLRDAAGFDHVYIRCGYVDLRQGIDGLARYIRDDMSLDPFAENTLYLFCGRRTDRINVFYHVVSMKKGCPPEEIQKYRTDSVRPMVDAFFAWIKEVYPKIDGSSETGKAIRYCIHQEPFLRAFLNNPIIPLDNNDVERSIKKFVVGRKNCLIADSVNGAQSSAVLYSIAETAKANGLKPYFYFKYVLEEMPKYMDGTNRSFIKDLLPWSEKLPDECYSKK